MEPQWSRCPHGRGPGLAIGAVRLNCRFSIMRDSRCTVTRDPIWIPWAWPFDHPLPPLSTLPVLVRLFLFFTPDRRQSLFALHQFEQLCRCFLLFLLLYIGSSLSHKGIDAIDLSCFVCRLFFVRSPSATDKLVSRPGWSIVNIGLLLRIGGMRGARGYRCLAEVIRPVQIYWKEAKRFDTVA